MNKIYQCIVNNPKKILVIFISLALIGAIVQNFVGVNYNMADYLPADSPSTVAIDVMEEEFKGGIPNVRVMIEDVTIPEALECKERLENCEGVVDVMWLDDVIDIYKPLELSDEKTTQTYYKDGDALFVVTMDESDVVTHIDNIKEVVGEDSLLTGESVSTAVATTNTVSEINIITIFAVLFVFVVLLVTTTSWFEPVIVMVGLGVAIMINNGSNIVFGEISFITNAAGPILQLAVSLDYSIFLIHRFEECLKENPNKKEAMVEALCKSTMSILSSGLTTVTGFLALVFMRFGIGPDMGVALAKGIFISLLTVFVFMPALILKLYPIMVKLQHKSFMPSFKRFGKVVYRVMIPVMCVFIVVVVPLFMASNVNAYYYGSSKIYGEGTEFGQDVAKIEDCFGQSDTYAVMVPNGDRDKEQQLSEELHKIPQVTSIISYVDTVGAEVPEEYLDKDTLSLLVSDNYSRMILTVDADYEGEKTFELVEQLRTVINKYYPDSYYLAGQGVVTYDLMDTITTDTMKVNFIAIGAVFVVLLLSLKSVSLPFILVLAIQAAIWINMGIPYFSDATVFYLAYLIISSIQLGATVDYAILFTDRYMEYRRDMSKKQAVAETVATVTTSLLTSGTVLAVIGFILSFVSSHGIISQLGLYLGRGTLLSMASVFFALPAMLYIFDGVIGKTTLNANFLKTKTKRGDVYNEVQ